MAGLLLGMASDQLVDCKELLDLGRTRFPYGLTSGALTVCISWLMKTQSIPSKTQAVSRRQSGSEAPGLRLTTRATFRSTPIDEVSM